MNSIKRRSTKRTPEEIALDFFGISDTLPRSSSPRKRKRKCKGKGKARGLQYRIQLMVRKTPRKIGFKPRVVDDEPGNDFEWGHDHMIALHTSVLTDAIETIRNCCEKHSPEAAIEMAWIERKGRELPFAFETCCELFQGEDGSGCPIGVLNPDVLRHQLRELIRKAFGTDLPHRRLLRAGIKATEDGDTPAAEWVMSNSSEPLSFPSCCTALGFDPDEARQVIRWPEAQRAFG